MEEDIAIANAISRSYDWVKYAVSNIDVVPTIWEMEDTPIVQINKNRKEIKKKVAPHYICKRCNKPGHHVSQCITKGDRNFDPVIIRGLAGIPRTFTVNITPEGVLSYLLLFISTHSFIEAKCDTSARKNLDGSYCTVMPRANDFKLYTSVVASSIPSNILCQFCKNIIKNPLHFPCCHSISFCAACVIPEDPISDPFAYCPICKRDCHIRKLIPSTTLEQEVCVYNKRKAREQLESEKGVKIPRML